MSSVPLWLRPFDFSVESFAPGVLSASLSRVTPKPKRLPPTYPAALLPSALQFRLAGNAAEARVRRADEHKQAKSNVFLLLRIYLMIDAYEEQQMFAEQCLGAFLKVLEKAPQERIFQ